MNDAEPADDQLSGINYRVGRRGSSLAKITTAERYDLVERVIREVMQAIGARNRLAYSMEVKAAGKRSLPGSTEPIDKTIEKLRGADAFDPVAFLEHQVQSRLRIIDRSHAEIEVLLKVRDLFSAIENPPDAGNRSSNKRRSLD